MQTANPVSAEARTTLTQRLAGEGKRTWTRLRPTSRRPCRLTCRGLGPDVEPRQVPIDLSLGGCAVAWTGTPPLRGASGTVELELPDTTVLLRAVAVHVRRQGPDRGLVGLRFLPDAALESALIPLGVYLLGLASDRERARTQAADR